MASIALDVFYDQVTSLFDQHASLQKLPKKEKSFKGKPWIHE